jgi:antitoxin YefM
MKTVSYSNARQNLAKTMKQVCEDHDPVIITNNGNATVVMLSLEDFESLEETSYLLKSPKNAKRLLESISQIEKGKGRKKELLD